MIEKSREIYLQALEQFQPTHIVSTVSGGKDSAASHQVAEELNIPIDFVIHGNTRTGIPETTEFVRDTYRKNYLEADAGTAYEDYVLRKGFFCPLVRLQIFEGHSFPEGHLPQYKEEQAQRQNPSVEWSS